MEPRLKLLERSLKHRVIALRPLQDHRQHFLKLQPWCPPRQRLELELEQPERKAKPLQKLCLQEPTHLGVTEVLHTERYLGD